MKNFLALKILFLIIIFLSKFSMLQAEVSYLSKGKVLFEKNKLKEAKIQFEKEIVYNPKSEESYLYLAKIFSKEEKINLQENNLKTVILLNPKNEEALYDLALLNIKNSNFSKTKELIESFSTVCKKLCSSKKNLENKLKTSSSK